MICYLQPNVDFNAPTHYGTVRTKTAHGKKIPKITLGGIFLVRNVDIIMSN